MEGLVGDPRVALVIGQSCAVKLRLERLIRAETIFSSHLRFLIAFICKGDNFTIYR